MFSENNKEIKDELITIIVVVLNAFNELTKTIKSIRGQIYKNIEIIVIDGESNDETLEYLRDNKGEIDEWKSEKDRGIYDAMNKGMDISKGEWVLFLNAGDTFYSDKVISEIYKSKDKYSDVDIIYGSVEILKKDFSYIKKSLEPSKIMQQMICCHQSIFFSQRVVREFRYDLNYKICGDYDLLMRAYKKGLELSNMNTVISKFAYGGLSEKKRMQRNFEEYKIIRNNYGFSIKIFLNFIKIISVTIVLIIITSLGARKIIDKLNKNMKA